MQRSRTKRRWRWVGLGQVGWVFVTWQVLQLFAVAAFRWPYLHYHLPSHHEAYSNQLIFSIIFHLDVSSRFVCVGERPGGVRSTLERYSEGRKEILCSHQEDLPRTSAWLCHTCKYSPQWMHSYKRMFPAVAALSLLSRLQVFGQVFQVSRNAASSSSVVQLWTRNVASFTEEL